MRTEKEKMVSGEFYDPSDAELMQERIRARELCLRLNHAPPGNAELCREIVAELFGSGGDSVSLQPPFFCDYGQNIHLGQRVFFNFNCVVLDVCPVVIGDYTQFGPAVQIYTASHPMNAMKRRGNEFGKPIEIGADVWVGGGAILCPGVKIGAKTVIGAGSVVTKEIPASVFAAGNPCRGIRDITEGD